eukprot:CAMPEP_0201523194 /NCGR_PEP_ID=MMETSP0161_2-20130828/18929_1 /ASSEMBLY_ACC=CAM_ASM_000251 /TAXON_ID=180227 /ORGANISM="Neoparamoeba aestuarina, Strain SoJaBio B1-5/56/2" /LENGTH=522 /DNA_ID=CAMNT_0047922217 /DNA_START=48 /DNA_END=1613 /DNA_ORIENTATION=+
MSNPSHVGCSLEDLMKSQGCGYIPDVVQKSLEFLSAYLNEPLFSQPGNTSEVKEIIAAYDQGRMKSLSNFTSNPQTVCSLMLEFLDCLPEPLVPSNRYQGFVDAAKGNDLRALRNLCDGLPEYNHALADCIFQFLNEGLSNGVKIEDLGRLGPVVLKNPGGPRNDADVALVVKSLIGNVDELFGIQRIEKLTDQYNIVCDLGSGAYAVAKKIVHKETGEEYAVKIIQKKHLEQRERDRLTMETNILKRVRHPNIIALKAVCETDDELFLIMELAEGGELFEHIVNQGAYSEDVAIDITLQIVSAVSYLHDLNIVHRDIKPENILLKREGTLELKLADFGLSKMFDATVRMQTTCGSPGYVAPEVLTDDLYGREVDMWSVGVIAYVLLSGFPPFYSENIKELFQQIMIAKYDFPPQYWSTVSDPAKDFVRKLLVRNPASRMSAQMALDHPWLTGTHGSGNLAVAGHMKTTQERDKEQKQNVADEVKKGRPNKKVREVTGHEHMFKQHTYYKPTWCEHCDDFLW